MQVRPVFNENSSRPYRWALKLVEQGEVIEQYWVETDNYTYVIDDEAQTQEKHDVYTFYPGQSTANFRPMRKRHVGFLTTLHRDFYEDGKYTEVLNDPVNYITLQPTDYGEAYLQAEQRIGNYRIGTRRNITHLGGTFTDDMLDNLSAIENDDFYPTASLSFPFFPPKPANYTQAERINLITTDSGYVNYLKSTHPSINNNETFLGEQGTGFRRIIYGADDLTTHATTLTDSGRVDVQDIETVLNAAIGTDLGAATGITTFLPISGEDITVNIPGQHIIRSESTGLSIEMYSDATLATLTTSIDIPKSSGDIIMTAGTTIATIAINII